MRQRKNHDAIAKVIAADLRGDPIDVKKPLYIEQNAYDIDIDTPIFRVFQIRHLLRDIREKRLTHTKVGPMIWGDPDENRLLNQPFTDEMTGERLSLEPLVENIYGVCWSIKPVATSEMWGFFSYGNSSVRIQSTPRKLLSGVMDLRNPYFMLQHFIGKIEYIPEREFETFYQDADYTKYLDSLGQDIALSVLRLPDAVSDEQEVRLVFQMDGGEEWAQQNVEIRDEFASVPFAWNNVIDAITDGPTCDCSTRAILEQELNRLGS